METIVIDTQKKEVRTNTIKHSKDNALEKHEQEELIKAIKSLENQELTRQKYLVIVHLLMDAGLRVSEAIQVRREWFNETEDGITINIPSSARDLRNLKRDWEPKTINGAREVIFIDKAIGERVNSYFINNPKGLSVSRQRIYQVIKLLGEKITKPELHPHALRSTYANTLVYAGVNASTLQYYMGWGHLNTAMHYLRTSKIAARKDLIEKFQNGTSEKKL